MINRLKAQAAKLGANGIIPVGHENHSAGSKGSGYAVANGNTATGIGVSSNIMVKDGKGVAIYVPPDDGE
ncbi:MAG TPA: hypothetical protein VFN13_06485 [Rudaea sp.]|nr:hypothetical protein [Rudaea sp.]